MSANSNIQDVSDEQGNAVSVIVPIELWHEIAAERETAYLLHSETMKRRLLEAKNRPKQIRVPVPSDEELEASYRAMAADTERENEALQWAEAMIGDALDETR